MAMLNLYLYQDTASLERILKALGTTIKDCSDQIDKAVGSGDEHWADSVTEDECGIVEDILGTAFVSCQVFITATVSGTRHFHALSKDSSAHQKNTVLSLGSPILPPTRYTRVQVIDAFANYFKHRDEWAGTWETLGGRSAQTVPVIQAVGAKEGATGNMRTAAKALGIDDFRNLDILHQDIQEWCDSVWNIYRLRMNAAHENEGTV